MSSKPSRGYAVKLTLRAERDLLHLYEYIGAASSEAAQKWYWGLKQEILSLRNYPNRCAAAPENKQLRHLLYGHGHNTYRIIFRVRATQVTVLHVRHGARSRIK